jgi:hypothetical protein
MSDVVGTARGTLVVKVVNRDDGVLTTDGVG